MTLSTSPYNHMFYGSFSMCVQPLFMRVCRYRAHRIGKYGGSRSAEGRIERLDSEDRFEGGKQRDQ